MVVLIKEVRTQTRGRPCEDTGERWSPINQEERSALLTASSQTSSHTELEKKYISIVSDTQSVVLCFGSPKTNIVGHKNRKSHWMPRASCCDVSLRSSLRSDGHLPPSAGNTTGRQPPAISFFQEFALDRATLSQVMPPLSGWSVSKTCCHVRVKAWSLCPTWFNSWKVIWLWSFPWSWLRPLLGLHHTFSASLQFFFLPPLPFHMDWSQGHSLIHFYLFI